MLEAFGWIVDLLISWLLPPYRTGLDSDPTLGELLRDERPPSDDKAR